LTPDPSLSLRNQPLPLERQRNLLDLSINCPDVLNVGLGPSSLLCVRRYRARLAFGCPWSGAQAAMQPTPGLAFEGPPSGKGCLGGF
jgi:hypothetical protein